MSIFARVVENLAENRQNRITGKVNSIPFHYLPKLNKVIPGIQKKRLITCTAGTKIGKSQLATFLYLIQPLEYVLNNPDKEINLKIFYFSLEVSKEAILMQLLSYRIYKDLGKRISPEMLLSVFEHYILDEEILKIIDDYKPWFEKVENIVTFNDTTKNPFGIYKTVREYALNNGKMHYKKAVFDGKEVDVEDYYESYKDEYVIIIVDHLSLLQPEKGGTLWESMFKFSSEYCLHLRDKYNFTIINVQQQSASGSSEEFTFSGNTILQKLKPNVSNLADCKLTARDSDIIIGLFSPYRYGIKKYGNINIEKFQDSYRELSIIQNRHGTSNATLDLLFLGDCVYFEEIPVDSEKFYTERVR